MHSGKAVEKWHACWISTRRVTTLALNLAPKSASANEPVRSIQCLDRESHPRTSVWWYAKRSIRKQLFDQFPLLCVRLYLFSPSDVGWQRVCLAVDRWRNTQFQCNTKYLINLPCRWEILINLSVPKMTEEGVVCDWWCPVDDQKTNEQISVGFPGF